MPSRELPILPTIQSPVRMNPVLPNLPPFLAFSQGRFYHLMPSSGNDGRNGLNPFEAVKTHDQLLSLMTANQNDIGLFYGEGNAASANSSRVSTTADWNKDFTHIVGVNSGSLFSPRARIAFLSTYDTASNLFTVSANACSFSGLQFFAGVAGVNPTGCLKVTGDRNHFYRCHIAGIGNNANDIAGAYSLLLDGAEENLFEECIIGLGTVAAGTAANAEIEFKNQCARNYFKNCIITRRIEHTTNHPLAKITGAAGIEDITIFENCHFINWSVNRVTAQTGIFKFSAAPTQGEIILIGCSGNAGKAATVKWDADDRDRLTLVNTPAIPPADTAGTERLV